MSASSLEPFVAEPPPLRRDDGGTVRVGDTRVTLDTVIGAWQEGTTAEGIVDAYDTLRLSDVYAVIAYYLMHREQVETYLKDRQQKSEDARARVEARSTQAEFRERLLARRPGGPHP